MQGMFIVGQEPMTEVTGLSCLHDKTEDSGRNSSADALLLFLCFQKIDWILKKIHINAELFFERLSIHFFRRDMGRFE